VARGWAFICVVGWWSNWEGVSGLSQLKARDRPSMYRYLMLYRRRNEGTGLDRQYNIAYTQYMSIQ
jgi:hypothetical protein